MKRILAKLLLLSMLVLTLPGTAWAQSLIPVGQVIGLQLRDEQVTVAAFDDVLGASARQSGLKIGDVIETVNGCKICCPEDVRAALSGMEETVSLTVRRGSRQVNVHFTPENTDDGKKLGVYLRQGITGIGTVTFFDPSTGTFGALGHGVNDSGGCLMQMTQGSAYDAQVLSVVRGRSGHPGQLKGNADPEDVCGEVLRNTPQGIFGRSTMGWQGEPVAVAQPQQLHTGSAVIVSTVDSGKPEEYAVQVVKLYPLDRTDGRNILLKVTDQRLLSATGGIVQGMSGSPILQDGRIVGAVTHVLVNDPTMGYGIYIGNMLDAALPQ